MTMAKFASFPLFWPIFPFSDDYWWLKPEQQTDDKKKKDKLKKEISVKRVTKTHSVGSVVAQPSNHLLQIMVISHLSCIS